MNEALSSMLNDLLSGGRFAVDCLWQPALVLLAGLALSRLADRPARAHRILLLALVAALLLPPSSYIARWHNVGFKEWITVPGNFQKTTDSTISVGTGAEDRKKETGIGSLGEKASDAALAPAVKMEEQAGNQRNHPPLPVATQPDPRWPMVMVGLWIAVSTILFARLLLAFRAGRRLIKRARPAEDECLAVAALDAAKGLGLAGTPEIFVSDDVRNPMIWLWRRRPALLLPPADPKVQSTIDWLALMRHELAHWKRGDHRASLIAELAVCALPWNPLAWIARKRLHCLAELACDDWALRDRCHPERYAEALLAFIPRREPMLLAHGMAVSRSTLALRVRRALDRMLADPRPGKEWAFGAALTALGAVLLLACMQKRIDYTQLGAGGPLLAMYEQNGQSDLSAIRTHLANAPRYPSLLLALGAARPGDVVWLPAGGYQGTFPPRNGVTIVGEDRDRTIIDLGSPITANGATGVQLHNLTLRIGKENGTGECLFLVNSRDVLVAGCRLTARSQMQQAVIMQESQACFERCIIEKATSGIVLIKDNDLEVRQSLFRELRQTGIFSNGRAGLTLTGNWFAPPGQCSLFSNIGNQDQTSLTMTGNTIVGQTNYGIYGGAKQVEIRNNTVIGSRFYGMEFGTQVRGVIAGNIMAGNRDGSIVSHNRNSTAMRVENNLFWQNGRHPENVTGDDAIKGDPKFSDLAGGDLRLKQDSAALGKGGKFIGAWGSAEEPTTASWMRPPVPVRLGPGGRVLVVDATMDVAKLSGAEALSGAVTLTHAMSDARQNDAEVERLNEEFKKLRPHLKAGPDLVANGDFEAGANGRPKSWTLAGAAYTTATWGEGLGWQGSRGIHIVKTSWKKQAGDPIYATFRQKIEVPHGDGVVEAALRIKTQKVEKAIFDLLFLDQKGEWISHIWLAPFGKPWGTADQDWQEVTRWAWVPPGTKSIQISIQMYLPGEVWIDDVRCSLLVAK